MDKLKKDTERTYRGHGDWTTRREVSWPPEDVGLIPFRASLFHGLTRKSEPFIDFPCQTDTRARRYRRKEIDCRAESGRKIESAAAKRANRRARALFAWPTLVTCRVLNRRTTVREDRQREKEKAAFATLKRPTGLRRIYNENAFPASLRIYAECWPFVVVRRFSTSWKTMFSFSFTEAPEDN